MATLLGALLRNESGGRNIANTTEGTSSGQAQGYFQITTGTWRDFARQAGVDLNRYPSPMIAADGTEVPYKVQAAVAGVIPLKRWDESTVAMMRRTGIPIDPNRTLAENLAANGEGFGDTPAGGRAGPRAQATPGMSMQAEAPSGPGRLGGDSMVARDFDPTVEAAQPRGQYALRARHPQNPQVGTNGFIAEGAPNLDVNGNPIASSGDTSSPYKPDTSILKDLMKTAGEGISGGKIGTMNPPDAGLGGQPKAALAQSQQSGLDAETLMLKRQKLAEAMARLQTGSLWG